MELALVQDLEEEVEDRFMGLLDLVEEHDAVRLLADLVDKQTALFVTDISRRRTVKERHGVLFLEFRHIEAQQRSFFSEEEFRQGLRELGLTGTRRPEEEERTHRLALLVEAGTGFENGVEHLLHSVILADDAFLENLFAAEQALPLPGLDLAERNAGLFGDDGAQVRGRQVLMMQLLGTQVIVDLDMRHRTVQEVDGRSREGFLRQVTLRELDGLLHHRLVQFEPVIRFIGGHDALEDLHRLVGGRLLYRYLLEVGDHFLVGLDILGVAVDTGRCQQLQLTFAQLILEDGGGAVKRALLVEELVDALDDEDGILESFHLSDDTLEAVFDLALVLGVAAKGGHIQLIGHCVAEEAGNLAGGHFPDETVHQGRLADAGLSGDQEIGLGLAAEDLVNDADLLFEADDIVEVAGPGHGGFVDTVLCQQTLAGCRGILLQLSPAHIGGFDIGPAAHLGADVRGGQGKRLELVEGEAHTGRHQGSQYAHVGAFVQAELDHVVLRLLQDGFGLFAVLQVPHRADSPGRQLHLYVSPVLQVVIILVEVLLQEVDKADFFG